MTTNEVGYLSSHFSRLGGTRRSRHRNESLLANYQEHLPKDRDARILEIGPGLGEFIDLAANRLGYVRFEAIDTSTDVVEHCNRHFGRTRHVEDTQEYLRSNARSFDRICLFHVLEHIPKVEVVPFLARIEGALRATDSCAIIEVPNAANPLVGSLYRYADFTHEVGFTSTSLAQVCRLAGFTSVTVRVFRTPITSPLRAAQYCGKFLIEGALRMLVRLYQQEPELMSANLVAIARTDPTDTSVPAMD